MSFNQTYDEALAKARARPSKSRKLIKRRGDLSGVSSLDVYDETGATAGLKRGTKRIGPGKKVKSWATERASLKRRFAAAGIITCELRHTGCAFDDYLGFAHAKKRRKLSKEDLGVVILACNFCHDKIEIDPRMEEIVMAVIAARKKQP